MGRTKGSLEVPGLGGQELCKVEIFGGWVGTGWWRGCGLQANVNGGHSYLRLGGEERRQGLRIGDELPNFIFSYIDHSPQHL